MAKFTLTDSKTGKTITVSGNVAPSDSEKEEIFTQAGLRNQPVAQSSSESTSTGPVLDLTGKIANFLFPQATKLTGQAYNNIATGKPIVNDQQPVTPTELVGSGMGPLAAFGLGEVGKVTGNQNIQMPQRQRDAYALAAEVAPWLMGMGMKPEMNTGTKILQGGKFGAMVGGQSGLANPQDTSLVDRGLGVASGIVGGGVTGAATTAGLLALQKLLSSGGNFLMKKVIRPETGSKPGWSARETKATENILKNTSGITPESVDTSIVKNLRETSNKVTKGLEKIKESIPVQGNGGLDEKIQSNLVKDYPALGSKYSFDVPEYTQTAAETKAQILNWVNAETGHSSTEVLEKIRPEALHKAEQNLGDQIRQLGGWKALANGDAISPQAQVKINIYNTLKDMLSEISPGMKELTEKEHQLLQASEGVYKWGHIPQSSYIQAGLRATPIIGQLLGLVNTGQAGLARGSYGAGQTMGNTEIQNLLQTLLTTGGVNAMNQLKTQSPMQSGQLQP